ncbi:MAG: hypothetical protein ABJK64_16895 [Paraglaciecola sp.]|uniref:hypothetical protein n=1 Tax=Paraglaciecola sp. TaxID=1920173 RepID=UPI00329A25A5
MKNILFLALMTSLLAPNTKAEESCAAQTLKAKYTIVKNTVGFAKSKTTLILWRKPNVVAHQYPRTHITEMWQKVTNDLIKPIRFFNKYERAIEYQPGESVHGKKELDWEYRNQLVSDTLITNMPVIEQQGKGCNQIEIRQKETENTKLTITWMPQLKLIKSFKLKTAMGLETWVLDELKTQDADTVNYFNKLYDYQTTDYADIGDDHTDPFLTKMVTLGFIEAGASGFYDDKGAAIGNSHRH